MFKKTFLAMCLIFTFVFSVSASFAASETKIIMSDDEIIVSGEKITKDDTNNIFLSSGMNNGGTSDDAKKANIDVKNIINIKESGVYEFSGTLTDGQIAIDTNNIKGEVVILLNNANITCKNAPAIFVYNVATKSETCNVIIKTAKESENYVYGGLIKQSVEGWEDQDKIVYSIEKNYNDEGEYFERYKYDGAISSDISLTFEGEGTLEIASEREGIEGKRDLTFNSGTYIINSTEDGINAAQDNESIITINGGKIVVNTSVDGPKGDGIDSNGYLYINGGEVYSFANPTSEDSGLDSDLGIYINGGKIVATGNMYDEINKNSKQKSVTYRFDKSIAKDTLITLVDENENPVIAFKTDRTYKILTFSNENLEDKEYTVYEGGKIEGTAENGLYTDIEFYQKGNVVNATKVSDESRREPFDKNFDMQKPSGKDFEMRSETNYKLIAIISIVLLICLALSLILIINKKSGILILVFGILIGISGTIIVNELGTKNEIPFEKPNQAMQNRRENLDF